MVIDRLSFECIEAIQQSHEMGHQVGLDTLPKEMLFAGIVAKPERALQTLQFYQMTASEVKQAALKVLQFQPGVIMTGRPDENKNRDEPLPFADDCKLLLSQAGTIADRMESDVIRSEHVLLALMGYNNGRDVETVPVVDVLREMTSIRKAGRGFTVTKFCNDLVQALPLTPMARDTVVQETTVVIGGGGARAGPSSNTNTLAEVGVDLTQLALDGKLDMVFGRDAEITSALRTLGRRRKNNPCLIGDPGVGKTAIAEGIAQVLANGLLEIQDAVDQKKPQNVLRKSLDNFMNRSSKNDKKNSKNKKQEEEGEIYQLPPCPSSLLGARLVSLELASLVAGTSNRGDFERKVKNVIREASDNNIILFIDEIHNLIGTGGGGDGAMNAANLLKPALARGELRVLGATTTPEYRRYIEKDAAVSIVLFLYVWLYPITFPELICLHSHIATLVAYSLNVAFNHCKSRSRPCLKRWTFWQPSYPSTRNFMESSTRTMHSWRRPSYRIDTLPIASCPTRRLI
jgi:ATP-dependent Clp protease ATP-binding subunit ClpC